MWSSFFSQPAVKAELIKIREFLRGEPEFAPLPHEMFKVFALTKPEQIKVVIIGQDPYHDLNPDGTTQAMGLAFSVRSSQKIPSSLQNIYKEAGIPKTRSGDLTHWSNQGVFLLNTALTVQLHKPDSHTKVWATFTELLIKFIDSRSQRPVFVLWGAKAQKFESFLSPTTRVFKSPHPSGLSAHRGFFGCNHFNLINDLFDAPQGGDRGAIDGKIDW